MKINFVFFFYLNFIRRHRCSSFTKRSQFLWWSNILYYLYHFSKRIRDWYLNSFSYFSNLRSFTQPLAFYVVQYFRTSGASMKFSCHIWLNRSLFFLLRAYHEFFLVYTNLEPPHSFFILGFQVLILCSIRNGCGTGFIIRLSRKKFPKSMIAFRALDTGSIGRMKHLRISSHLINSNHIKLFSKMNFNIWQRKRRIDKGDFNKGIRHR